MTLNDKMIRRIEDMASNYFELEDDFDPMDYSGSNFNDCYEMGVRHGMAAFASELLSMLQQEE